MDKLTEFMSSEGCDSCLADPWGSGQQHRFGPWVLLSEGHLLSIHIQIEIVLRETYVGEATERGMEEHGVEVKERGISGNIKMNIVKSRESSVPFDPLSFNIIHHIMSKTVEDKTG